MNSCEEIVERRAFATRLTFLVTTVGSCVWSAIATLIADYVVQPDMPFGLGIFFLLSLPCSVPLACVAVILGRCVSRFRYSKILLVVVLASCCLWLLRVTRETKVVSERAWETGGAYESDPAIYVLILFGLPPLAFGAFFFALAARGVPPRTRDTPV